MVSFDNHAGVSESARGSRPIKFSTGARSAALLIASTPSLISHLKDELRTWRRRERERAQLAQMSLAELHDIGLTSADRWAEIGKPFWRK